ncbi:hypothetical protein [Microcoleus sp.]|uniref:hypothetical protein n=1 Tax=Microcoleus sp. TaxID=44472 RepID=UPI00403ECE84
MSLPFGVMLACAKVYGRYYIAILNKVRYALCPMPYALCPMPYALCPRSESTSCY